MAQARRAMEVTGDQLIRRARKTIRHTYYDRLLQAQDVGQLGKLRDRFHDRELRSTWITKQMGDSFVEQEFDKRLAAGHFLNRHFLSLRDACASIFLC